MVNYTLMMLRAGRKVSVQMAPIITARHIYTMAQVSESRKWSGSLKQHLCMMRSAN